MVIRETLEGGYVHTYSDQGYYIHGGYPEADYEDVIDPISANRTYTETDRAIEDWEDIEPMIARDNITNGQYFTINKTLYISTASIARGESIVVGQNCEEAPIANVLNNLKEN